MIEFPREIERNVNEGVHSRIEYITTAKWLLYLLTLSSSNKRDTSCLVSACAQGLGTRGNNKRWHSGERERINN